MTPNWKNKSTDLLFWFLFAAFCWILNSRANSIPLTSLDLTKMTSGWGSPQRDLGIAGSPLSIGGKKFANGVGTHANSKLRLELGGRGKRFSAQIGVDDSAGLQGSVEFIITGDDKILWQSGVVSGGKPAIPVDISIVGIHVLSLRVSDFGDGTVFDHADWAEAAIEMADPNTRPATLAPYETFALNTDHFSLGFWIGDDKRLYQRPIGGTEETNNLSRTEEAYPQAGDGYIWEPALQVVHGDGNTSTDLVFDGLIRTNEPTGSTLAKIKLHDPAYPFEVNLCFRSFPAVDVIEQWAEIRHHESRPVKLSRMASSSMVLVPTNLFLMHFFGDWSTEMNTVTEPLTPGIKVLDSKIGVRAHQYGNPSFILSLDGQPSETSGRILAGSLAWSGSFQCAFDHNGGRLRTLAGVNPFASTYQLPKGETFATPVMIWVWSASGMGDMSRKFHSWARDFGIRDGHQPREVLLNNWEATGFDFDFQRIVSLFDSAEEIGTELILLDDGWFGNKYPRLNDRAGLGDWEPNRQRFPNGLAPLAAEAQKRGLHFGIWMEPEMVNPKSQLFERHPDWIISQPKRELELQRNQLVLDLTRPAVQKFERQLIDGILKVPGLTYAKWDCNRYLTQPGSSFLPADRQSHLWIDYVHALYRLMAQTVKEFPRTELMLCSGGGGRVDYGALKYFHEFWPSDNTDPMVKVPMQWNYSYFFPLMTVASHVTHSGNHSMHFACSVAMSARFGMDLDLVKLSAADKAVCTGAIAAYKHIRDVTQLGDLYRLENPHDGPRCCLNFVSQDRSRAVAFVFQMKDGAARPVLPQGLSPGKNYVVHELNPAADRASLSDEGKSFTGGQLMKTGILPSCSKAAEACVIELGQ
jgi:alpha-galactosidase